MATNEIYDTGFDEESGKHLSTTDCPECPGRLVTDGGETACEECGLILEERRLDRRGRRTFADDDGQKERTGPPLTQARHDRGLSTKIGYRCDGSGNTLSGRKRRQLSRLRREHTRAKWQSKAERNLAHGCGEIARVVAALELTREVREQASSLFRTAQSDGLLQGRSIDSIAAGCVYAVCRCSRLTRTLEEVAEVAQCSEGSLNNAYGVLNRELGLPTPPRRPREFIAGHASALGLSPETEHVGRELATKAAEAGLSNGPNPSGVAAACLAVAAVIEGVDVRQSSLASVADVSPATVRTHRDAICAEFGEVVQ